MSNTPSDKEIVELAISEGTKLRTGAGVVRLARAVLAKWGTPQPAPAQQEWRLVLPGGRHTDEWESARVGDYNRGWNDYRKAAIAALNSVVWPARTSGSWVGASTWLRNNYQDYPNIASLCDAMLEAAPQQEPASPIRIGWGRDYLDNGKPIDASAAPVPDFAAILQQEAQEPIGWTTGITWRPNTRLQSEQVIKITRDAQPKYGYTTPIYTAPQQGAQEPCPTCAALARTVMLDQVSFDRKPDCYGIRQITDDEGIEEWEDIRTSPDVAREEANDMMATGRGEIYEVVPLWTTPQPSPTAKAADSVLEDAARYRFLAGHCRSTSEHWGGRWSIIVDGPAPKSHDSENDFDEAVDAARKQGDA